MTLRPLSVPWTDPASVQLFATIERELSRGPREALRALGGDLLLLAPVGALLPVVSGRLGSWAGSFVRTVLAGGLLALGLEVLRSTGPGQMLNVDSLLLNTTGVALGHLLLYPLARKALRRVALRQAEVGAAVRRTVRGSQGLTPRTARVDIAPWADASRSRAPYV